MECLFFLEVTHWIFYAIKIEAGSYHICIDNRKDCDSIVMKGDNSMKNLVMKYKKTIIFLGVYSILFGCLALWLDSIFATANKTFIWGIDGLAQHVVALKYIRNALITFFTTGKFTMMDYTIGQGFDAIGTLNYYGLGDPITLLTVFFPEKSLERMYEILIFVRMYLSGISVAYLCKTLKKTRISAVLPASLLYAFSTFVLLGGIRHPMFFCGIMYLPLLIAGVEKVIRDKRIGTLTVVVALSFASNYYFMYINTIMAAVYFFIRQVGTYRIEGIKKLCIRIGKIILSYIWGIALSAVIFFPAVYAFLNIARTGTDLANPPLFFPEEYYQKLFAGFMTQAPSLNEWAVPGIGILGIFSLCVLIAHWKKEDRRLLLGFAVIFIMLVFPYVGKIMNGFSYVTMRFSYAMTLVLAIMLVYAIYALQDVQVIPMLLTGFLFVGMYGYLILNLNHLYKKQLFSVTAVLGFVCIVIMICYLAFRNGKYSKYIIYAISLVSVASIAFSCYSFFDIRQHYLCYDYVDRGGLTSAMGPRSVKMMKKSIHDDSFYRVERERDFKNKSTFFGFHQTCFYWSIIPSGMTDLFVSTGISDYYTTYFMKGLEKRPGLLSLASVKYCVDYEKNAPFGFYKIADQTIDGKKMYLYQNACYLPLGVTYSSYMTKEQYDKLNPAVREQALLTSAVVDEKVEGIKNNNQVTGIKIMPISVREQKKANINNFKIKVRKGAVIEYGFDGEPDSQTYIVFKNIHSKDSDLDRKAASFKGKYGNGRLRVIGDYSARYFHKDGNVLNLGYSKKPQKKFTLKFYKKRKYILDGAYAVCVPISEYLNHINDLRKNTMQDVKVQRNLITGNIRADKDEILQISVPYSRGYTVFVDGKKTDSFQSGVAYLGVKIAKGNHSIKIKYRTPFLRMGFIVTIIAALLFAGCEIVWNRKNRKR